MSLTVTDLLTCCQGMLVTHLEFSSLVTLWKIPQNATKSEHSFLHQKMNGPEKKLSDNSTKCSITREQLQGSPLTKQDILETYADIFTRIGKFPGLPYKFQLKPNAKPTRHAPRKVPIHLQDAVP